MEDVRKDFNIGIGDVVQHFKRETIADSNSNQYLYIIKGIAEHTETKEQLVIYQALYSPFKTYARPYNMFSGKVDKKKYPTIRQVYRFEKIKAED